MAEREWREARDLRPKWLGIALVVVSGGALRFWALDHGIPFAPAADEPVVVETVLRMMKSGDFHPHFFGDPALYLYVQLVIGCARFVHGALMGLWQSLNQVDLADFYVWGRAGTAIIGTATIWVVYQIGMQWGSRHALLAAGLMAVSPAHVRESHYVLADVPMTFFVTMAFWLSLRAYEKATTGAFAWAGTSAGLAAATKYSGVPALVLPLLAAYMTAGAAGARSARALAVLGGCTVAFLAGAPYTVLDLPSFLNTFAQLAGASARARLATDPPWPIYLGHLQTALGWPGLVLVCAGLALGIVRAATGPGGVRSALLVMFPLTYLLFIAWERLVPGRYLLPILPFVSLLAAVAVISGVSLLRRFDIPRAVRTGLIAGLTIAAVLPPALNAIDFNRQMGKISTQAAAYAWITRNLPDGSSIVAETGAPLLPRTRYRVEVVQNLIDRDHAAYVAGGYDYLIASSQAYQRFLQAPQEHPAEYAAYRRIFDQSAELMAFHASNDRPGPAVRILKVPR